MAYQKRNKGPRYQSTGSVISVGKPGLKVQADLYKMYLKGLMTSLQNAARQAVFRAKPYHGSCFVCGENDTSKFYVDYGNPPQTMDLCQAHHKEYSQMRGTIYDQLKRHGIDVLSWEDWKNGMRPVKAAK